MKAQPEMLLDPHRNFRLANASRSGQLKTEVNGSDWCTPCRTKQRYHHPSGSERQQPKRSCNCPEQGCPRRRVWQQKRFQDSSEAHPDIRNRTVRTDGTSGMQVSPHSGFYLAPPGMDILTLH